MAMGFGPLADPAGRKWQGRAEQQKAARDLMLQRPQKTGPPAQKAKGRFRRFAENYSRGGGAPVNQTPRKKVQLRDLY